MPAAGVLTQNGSFEDPEVEIEDGEVGQGVVG